jgi:hypothetical protein
VYLLYVDESGDDGLRGSKHLILTGAALFEGQWMNIHNDIQALLARYSTGLALPFSEIHCSAIRAGKGEFSRIPKAQRLQLVLDAGQLCAGLLPSELRAFSVIIDKAYWRANNPGAGKNDLYLYAFEDLTSRFDLFLRRRFSSGNPSKGMVIVDPSKSPLSNALKQSYKEFRVNGNRWSRIRNLIETLLFLPSHESPGVQVADVASYAVWRQAEMADASLALQCKDVFDREPLTSELNPGKWHGIKYVGSDPAVIARIRAVWP